MALMQYRPEVDGLRALAVVSVILFHAGFSLFGGGFVGVDVFFVISGYLITTIILSELKEGKFSVLNFYERRARRILPALFLVLFSCLPFAWLILYPNDLRDFADSLVAVVTFSSNIYFWRNSSYFDTASELKPLLHTWSLAVEEQYYAIAPIVLVIIWRLGWRWIKVVLGIAVLSVLMAQWGSQNVPSLNFYMLPTRFWELLLGGVVAYYSVDIMGHKKEFAEKFLQLGSVIGLCLICYSTVFFDKQMPFPSFYTLVPTGGAALVILCSSSITVVGKFLSQKIMVMVGLISYSAYLWHQPIFAFTRQYCVEEPSRVVFALLSLLSLGLAYCSWRFVELPFRQQRYGGRGVVALSLVGLLVFGIVGIALPHMKKSYPLTVEEQKVYSFVSYDFSGKARRNRCFLDSASQPPSNFAGECTDVDSDAPKLLVWGDSHAAALSIGLRVLRSNVIQYTSNNCPPIYGRDFVTAKYCGETNKYIIDEIRRLQPEIMIMHGYWHSYYGGRLSLLSDTISTIRKLSPKTKIVLIGGVPLWTGSLPLLMLKHGVLMEENVALRSPLYGELRKIDEHLKSVADQNGVVFVSALDSFCNEDGICRAVVPLNGNPSLAAFDYGHLTEAGAIHLASHVLAFLS